MSIRERRFGKPKVLWSGAALKASELRLIEYFYQQDYAPVLYASRGVICWDGWTAMSWNNPRQSNGRIVGISLAEPQLRRAMAFMMDRGDYGVAARSAKVCRDLWSWCADVFDGYCAGSLEGPARDPDCRIDLDGYECRYIPVRMALRPGHKRWNYINVKGPQVAAAFRWRPAAADVRGAAMAVVEEIYHPRSDSNRAMLLAKIMEYYSFEMSGFH